MLGFYGVNYYRKMTFLIWNHSLFGNSISWFAVESSAPGIVNHQQVDIHVPANQKLKGIHVPGETQNLYQNCSLSKNVPRLQKSKEGLQNSGTTNILQS